MERKLRKADLEGAYFGTEIEEAYLFFGANLWGVRGLPRRVFKKMVGVMERTIGFSD